MPVRLYYHYTTVESLHEIHRNGYIPTTDPALHQPPHPSDPACVWLLDTPEPSRRPTPHPRPTTAHHTQVRFTVLLPSRQAVPWSTWAPTVSATPHTVTELIVQAGQENAAHWHCRFAPLTPETWHAVHYQPTPRKTPWEPVNFAHLPPIPTRTPRRRIPASKGEPAP